MIGLALLVLQLGGGCTGDGASPDDLAAARRLVDANDLNAAASAYEVILHDHPEDSEALIGQGWVLLLLDEGQRARDAFDRCQAVAPKEAECLRGRASVVAATGNTGAAGEILAEALALEPGDPKVRSTMALLAVQRDDAEEAEAIYRALITEEPNEGGYRAGLAEALLRQRRFDEALTAAEGGMALTGVPVRIRGMLEIVRARTLLTRTEASLASGCGDAARARADIASTIPVLDRLLEAQVTLPGVALTRNWATTLSDRIAEECAVDPARGSLGTQSPP